MAPRRALEPPPPDVVGSEEGATLQTSARAHLEMTREEREAKEKKEAAARKAAKAVRDEEAMKGREALRVLKASEKTYDCVQRAIAQML